MFGLTQHVISEFDCGVRYPVKSVESAQRGAIFCRRLFSRERTMKKGGAKVEHFLLPEGLSTRSFRKPFGIPCSVFVLGGGETSAEKTIVPLCEMNALYGIPGIEFLNIGIHIRLKKKKAGAVYICGVPRVFYVCNLGAVLSFTLSDIPEHILRHVAPPEYRPVLFIFATISRWIRNSSYTHLQLKTSPRRSRHFILFSYFRDSGL